MFDASSICGECTALSTRIGMELEDGTPADPAHGIYIHHIAAIDVSREGVVTSLPCDFDTIKNSTFDPMVPFAPFAVQGEDNGDAAILYTAQDGTFDSGFHVGAKDRFILNTDLVNYNTEDKKIFITLDVEYVDGKVGLDAQPNLMNVVGCKLAEPKISTTGPTETISRKFPILVDGSIIWMSKDNRRVRSGLS
jgi:hypothetical protein